MSEEFKGPSVADKAFEGKDRSIAKPRGRRSITRMLMRPAADALATWVVFAVITMSVACGPLWAKPNLTNIAQVQSAAAAPIALKAAGDSNPAPLIEIATTQSANSPNAVYRRTSAGAAWLLLSAAVSLLVALNLALFRHLRHAYAGPARRRGH